MIKKTIKYVDFNGTERLEDFYFHMSQQEATRFTAKFSPLSVEEYFTRLAENESVDKLLDLIEEIILGAYGVKTDDGRSFMKDPAETAKFEYSQAYAELFEELLLHPEKMGDFVEGIGMLVPKKQESVGIMYKNKLKEQ